MKAFSKTLFTFLLICSASLSIGQWTDYGNNIGTTTAKDVYIDGANGEYLIFENNGTVINSLDKRGLRWTLDTDDALGTDNVGTLLMTNFYDYLGDRLHWNTTTSTADPFITIESSSGHIGFGTGDPNDQLHIVGSTSADIRLEASGSKNLRFYEGSSPRGFVGHSGFNVIIQNDQTNGIVEIDGQVGVDMRINNTEMLDINSNRLLISGLIDVGIGDGNPAEKLEVAGNMALSSPEDGGTLAEDRNHLIYGVGGKKRLQFSSNSNATNSWAWINMFGDETCLSCEGVPKRGNMSMAGQRIIMRVDNDNTGFGDVALTIENDQKATFSSSVTATSFITASDRQLKSNVEDYTLGLDAIKKMHPKSYVYNGTGGIGTKEMQVGLIAQDLEKIAPELITDYVFSDPRYDIREEYLAIKSDAIKYILVNAVKELATENDNLKEENYELRLRLDRIEALLIGDEKPSSSTNQLNAEFTDIDNAQLAQNIPNPFHENTVIKYFLPEGITGAQMNIFDQQGKLLKAIPILETGQGQLNLKANALHAGNYTYQLVTDQGTIGSKPMILVK